MSVSIKPLEDRIVVKPLDAEQTTASGLVIPDTAKEKPQEGEVLAVGPGRFDDNGNARAARRPGRRQRHLLQVRRHRGQVRRRGVPRPLRARRARRRRQVTEPTRSAARPGGPPRPDGRRPPGRAPSRHASSSKSSEKDEHMAKILQFDETARRALERGVDALANAVKVTLGPRGPQRRHRQEVGRPDHHERRRHHRPRGRARRPVREPRRPARQGGRHQDQRRRR